MQMRDLELNVHVFMQMASIHQFKNNFLRKDNPTISHHLSKVKVHPPALPHINTDVTGIHPLLVFNSLWHGVGQGL